VRESCGRWRCIPVWCTHCIPVWCAGILWALALHTCLVCVSFIPVWCVGIMWALALHTCLVYTLHTCLVSGWVSALSTLTDPVANPVDMPTPWLFHLAARSQKEPIHDPKAHSSWLSVSMVMSRWLRHEGTYTLSFVLPFILLSSSLSSLLFLIYLHLPWRFQHSERQKDIST
jgi:hypothetical protein